jgi:hypothetical protein
MGKLAHGVVQSRLAVSWIVLTFRQKIEWNANALALSKRLQRRSNQTAFGNQK